MRRGPLHEAAGAATTGLGTRPASAPTLVRMWKNPSRAALVILAAALVATPALAQDRGDSHEPPRVLSVEAGQALRYRFTRQRSASGAGLPRASDDSISQEFTLRVKEATSDGGATATIEFGQATGHYTMRDGPRVDLEEGAELPAAKSNEDLVLPRSLTYLSGRNVEVTLDGRGRVTAEAGMREAMQAAFAGTPFAKRADEFPDADARGELRLYIPPRWSLKKKHGAVWADDLQIDFGAWIAFKFSRVWSMTVDADEVRAEAECSAIPDRTVPEGQDVAGKGSEAFVWSRRDGLLLRHTSAFTFKSEGDRGIDATARQVLERIVAEESPLLVTLNVKPDETFRFRRTLARSAVCEQLGRDGDDTLTQDVAMTVASVTEDGGVVLDLEFGPFTGRCKLADGKPVALDTQKGLPEVDNRTDLALTRGLTFLGGAKVRVTLDSRGRPTHVDGVGAAMAKAFKGTEFEALVAELPMSEALREMEPFFPPLPQATTESMSWQDTASINFGSLSKFSYEHRWTLATDDTAYTASAELEHVPGATVPAGQTNEGTGTITSTRSKTDGFVLHHETTATFKGRGNFDIDTKFHEVFERVTK